VQATVVARRGSRALVVAVVAAAAIAGLVLAAGAVVHAPSRNEAHLALAAIPEGVSLQRVGAHAAAVVRDGDDITAFVPGIPVGDAVVWCPGAHRFTSVLHASHYAIDGRRLGGPGPSTLATYATHVRGDRVTVDLATRFDVAAVPWTDALVSRWGNARDAVCAY
jgi:hypothetical protein